MNELIVVQKNSKFNFMTLLMCSIYILFILPMIFTGNVVNASSGNNALVIEEVCISTSPIIWEKKNNIYLLKSDNLYKSLNPCASQNQEMVMVPLDFVIKDSENIKDFKRNVLVYNRENNVLIRYDPVEYGRITSFNEELLDETLNIESKKMGIKYKKESYNGIIPGITMNLYDTVKYTEPGRNSNQLYESKFQESTNYLDTLPKEIFDKAYNFLDEDFDVNLALREDDAEELEMYKDTIEFMDELIDNAPRLKEDLVLLKGIHLRGEWKKIIEKKQMIIIDPSYQFVTSVPEIATNYGDFVLKIRVPAGTPILAWEYLSDNPNFHEIILPRNGRYNIKKIKGKEIYVDFTLN